MAAGFIYVLSCKSIPGQVKIGRTIRHPKQRVKELETTGVPCPFEIEFAVWVYDCEEVEKTIHEHLTHHNKRVSPNREFFEIDVSEAVLVVAKETICGFDLDADQADAMLQEPEVCRVAKTIGCHPFEIPRVFECVPDNAWGVAYQMYKQRQAERLAKRRSST